MSKAIKCDRCNEVSNINYFTYTVAPSEAMTTIKRKPVNDLCYNCASELQKLLKKFFGEVK